MNFNVLTVVLVAISAAGALAFAPWWLLAPVLAADACLAVRAVLDEVAQVERM